MDPEGERWIMLRPKFVDALRKRNEEARLMKIKDILHDEFGDRGIVSFQSADQPPREDKTNPIVLTGIRKK